MKIRVGNKSVAGAETMVGCGWGMYVVWAWCGWGHGRVHKRILTPLLIINYGSQNYGTQNISPKLL